jgi:WS/DGAT/MGAT family acyltransferase
VRRLSGLDASFLALDGPSGVGHLCLVVELGGSVTAPELVDLLARRLAQLPVLRERLQAVPLNLGRPFWVTDPHFEVTDHVFEHDLPTPGDGVRLAELVTAIAATPLDRDRPLWEMHVVHGLSGARSAVVTKIHHAAIDGIAGVELLSTLLDTSPEGARRPMDPLPAVAASTDVDDEHDPTLAASLVQRVSGLSDLPVSALRLQGRLLRQLPALATRALDKVTRLSQAQVEWLIDPEAEPDGPTFAIPKLAAPPSPFNRSVGLERALALAEVDLQLVRPVRERFGVTVNDVLLAATSSGLRRWLIEHEDPVDATLRALVPVSVRAPDGGGGYGNQIALTVSPLPVDEADPVARLARVHEAMLMAKQQHAISADNLQDITRFAVPALATRAARLAARIRLADRIRLPFNVMVSNVPGPRELLYLAGHEVRSIHPVPTISDGLGLNITAQGYRGRLHLGFVTTPHIVPDVWEMARYVVEGFDELAARA